MPQTFLINAVVYDLAHLSSFTVTIPSREENCASAKLVVTFGHHVFTEQWDDAHHTIDLAITENGERRAFCLERYNWSQDLAGIIRYHVAGRAFWGRDRNGNWNNFFYEQRNGRVNPYAIYFRVGKASNIKGVDGILHIISAYENPDLPKARHFQSIKFATIVGKEIGFKQTLKT